MKHLDRPNKSINKVSIYGTFGLELVLTLV